MTILTIGPLAHEFFSGMEGTYDNADEFMARYRERIAELGPAPRLWDKRDAFEWAREQGYLTVSGDRVTVQVTGPPPAV